MDVSVIICTQNRAASLAVTLGSFATVHVPANWTVEILVVDNASTDDTATVARSCELNNFEVRYLHEARKGKCHGLNAALAEARGQVFLFTDDDVRPAEDWLVNLARPLLEGECDGVVGRIVLAADLHRSWMTEAYWGGLAKYEGPKDEPVILIGANMGFHRNVLQLVPAFDGELGPGALGFFDDCLFGWQMVEAGLRVEYISGALVIHHADGTRLLRPHCLNERKKIAASLAYILHHWRHGALKRPRWRYYYLSLKLTVRRALQRPFPPDAEGLPPWERSYVYELERCRQFLIERRRPRNYTRRGLVKLPASNRKPRTEMNAPASPGPVPATRD